MPETRFQGANSASPSVSYIPVMASPVPRKPSSRGALASPFSLSQFSLLPSPRASPGQGNPLQSSPISVSSSPSYKPSPSPSPAPAPSGFGGGSGSGIPKFRSLRNMLPFGPKQSPAPTSATTPAGLKHRRSASSVQTPSPQNPPRAGFMTFGPRNSFSVNMDKKLPAPPSPIRARSEDHAASPVITIDAPPAGDTSQRSVRFDTGDPFARPSPRQSPKGNNDSFHDASLGELDVSIPRSGDLSTIIESELSSVSMSRHLPPLESSPDSSQPRIIDIVSNRRNSQASEIEEEAEADDDEPMLAQLVRDTRQASVAANILRPEDVHGLASPAVHPRPADASTDLSATWAAGLADFGRSMVVRGDHIREQSAGTSSSVSPASVPSPVMFQDSPAQRSSRTSSEPTPDGRDGQISFDLAALDPDLAALLSPHNLPPRHMDDEAAAILAAADAVPPPVSLSPSPSPEPHPDQALRDTRTSTDPGAKRTSGESRRRSYTAPLGLQSSPPARRSRPTSLALSASSHSTAADARRMSLDGPPTAKRAAFPTPMPGRGFDSPAMSSDGVLSGTSGDALTRPALGRSYSLQAGSSPSGDPHKRRALTPRLYTPARPSIITGAPKARVASDSRAGFRSSQAREDEDQSPSQTAGSLSPVGRSVSALGISSSVRRALGMGTERPASALSRTAQLRNRKRSMSVNEVHTPPTRKPPDWMGPRTARAFAAAGLLDPDKERERDSPHSANGSRPEARSRAATPRTTNERDLRASVNGTSSTSLYAPSRAGFSDVSRSGSWGRRGSSSRAMTVAELSSARGDSPVTTVTSSTPTSASNPKTPHSSSTATSLSSGSPHVQFQYYQLESTLQTLKEKHSLEMEALLGALADSQRSSRSLREENTQLRGRIQDLEDQIGDLVAQLEATHRSPQPPRQLPNFARTMLSHSRPGSRSSSAEHLPMRHSRMQSFVSSNLSVDESDSVTEAQITMREPTVRVGPNSAVLLSERSARKRSSTASSVFPILPSNMSMLLHEDGDADNSALYSSYQPQSRVASSPPSPTLLLSSLNVSAMSARSKHATKPSVSSVGSGGSTSADLSAHSMPGSPGSLQLRPEHEKHLGDMMSLDLSIVDDSDE